MPPPPGLLPLPPSRAGSEAHGFWYHLQHVVGRDTCPMFTPLNSFASNVAHSCNIYGLRIFPEY